VPSPPARSPPGAAGQDGAGPAAFRQRGGDEVVGVVTRLREHRDRLDRLAAALLEHESLDEADVYRIAADSGRRAAPAPACPA
jgi:hypothetical protein